MWGRILLFAIAGGLIGFIVWVIMNVRKEKSTEVHSDRRSELRDSIKKDLEIIEKDKEIEELRAKLDKTKGPDNHHFSDN